MIAYFVRKLLGGFLVLWLVTLIGFTALVEGPAGPRHWGIIIDTFDPVTYHAAYQLHWQRFYVDKPWLLNYGDWLLDPEAPDWEYLQDTDRYGIANWRHHTKPSGILTGDFVGSDSLVDSDSLAGWWLPHLAMFSASLFFAMVATLQCWRRPPPHHATRPPTVTIRDSYHLTRFSVFV